MQPWNKTIPTEIAIATDEQFAAYFAERLKALNAIPISQQKPQEFFGFLQTSMQYLAKTTWSFMDTLGFLNHLKKNAKEMRAFIGKGYQEEHPEHHELLDFILETGLFLKSKGKDNLPAWIKEKCPDEKFAMFTNVVEELENSRTVECARQTKEKSLLTLEEATQVLEGIWEELPTMKSSEQISAKISSLDLSLQHTLNALDQELQNRKELLQKYQAVLREGNTIDYGAADFKENVEALRDTTLIQRLLQEKTTLR